MQEWGAAFVVVFEARKAVCYASVGEQSKQKNHMGKPKSPQPHSRLPDTDDDDAGRPAGDELAPPRVDVTRFSTARTTALLCAGAGRRRVELLWGRVWGWQSPQPSWTSITPKCPPSMADVMIMVRPNTS